jgi:hypothetical protein
MIDDPYLAMAVGAQALRRRIERQSLGMGGALGVAVALPKSAGKVLVRALAAI